MVELLPGRCRLVAVLLGVAGSAALAAPARADVLISAFTGDAGRSGKAYEPGSPGSPIAFRSGRREDAGAEAPATTEADPLTVARMLFIILAVPAGTVPMTDPTPTSVPPPVQAASSPPPGNGGNGGSGGNGGNGGNGGAHNPIPTPEPASWLSALIGCGLAGLAARRRRRAVQGC
jgi:hypothetical protein